MKIPVTCARCGKRYEVDGAYAGKKGKCATCGERMMIPAANQPPAPAPPESDAYQLDDVEDGDRSTSFASARGTEVLDEAQSPRRQRKRSPGRAGQKRAERAGSHPALSGRTTLIALAVVLVAAVTIAFVVPGTRMNVGRAVAVAGLILFVYGYASGAYIAFTEDDLYGWLYLLFPPYAAYYFVSRWDEMSSRLVMLIVGLALLSGGGVLLEMERPTPVADKAATV